jgi:hypothetical protein
MQQILNNGCFLCYLLFHSLLYSGQWRAKKVRPQSHYHNFWREHVVNQPLHGPNPTLNFVIEIVRLVRNECAAPR